MSDFCLFVMKVGGLRLASWERKREGYITVKNVTFPLQYLQVILQIFVKGFQFVYRTLCSPKLHSPRLAFLSFIIRSSISAY